MADNKVSLEKSHKEACRWIMRIPRVEKVVQCQAKALLTSRRPFRIK